MFEPINIFATSNLKRVIGVPDGRPSPTPHGKLKAQTIPPAARESDPMLNFDERDLCW